MRTGLIELAELTHLVHLGQLIHMIHLIDMIEMGHLLYLLLQGGIVVHASLDCGCGCCGDMLFVASS